MLIITLSMGQLSSIFRFSVRVIISLAMMMVWVPWAISQGVVQGFESEIQDIFHRTRDSVVQIKTIVPVTDAQKGSLVAEALSSGTGFFIDNQGHIFTAASVLRGCSSAIVYWRGKAYEATSFGEDPRTNLALLKIDAQTPSLPFGDPDALKIGSLALAVGYPADAPISAEYGFISNMDALQMAKLLPIAPIRCSIRAQPGQSGSPILNSKGEVVGVLIYSMMDDSSTFALPITAAQKIRHDLQAYHKPRPGWTGLTIDVAAHSSSFNNNKVSVRDVYLGYPGHAAGICPGDILVKVGDKQIHTPTDVMNATFYLSIGETVNFTVERNGETKAFPVKVVPRPSEKELLALKPVNASSTSAR